MKTITTVLIWLGLAAALVALYLFVTVTCAPVKHNSMTRLSDTLTIAAFALAVILQALRAIVNKITNHKISH